jgi:hypothetical protein
LYTTGSKDGDRVANNADFIDEKLTTVQYSKFNNVIYIIKTLNEHVKIGNIYIKSAFRFFKD